MTMKMITKPIKHRNLVVVNCPDNKYTVNCVLGNFHISTTKVKNKNVFHLHAYSNDLYSQSLVRKYDSELNREEITYKSLNEVLIAIEKACNTKMLDLKFYYGESV